IDVVGYYASSNPPLLAPGNLRFINPVRVVDTRGEAGGPIGLDPNGWPVVARPLAPGDVRRFLVAGRSFGDFTFPSDVSGLLAHVTIVQGAASGGFVTLFPGDLAAAPNASTVNPSAPIAFNTWAMGIPTSGPNTGTLGVFSTNALDVVVDVMGYWAPSNTPGTPGTAGELTFVNPTRVLDTRGADVGGPLGVNPDGTAVTTAPLAPGTSRRFLLAGRSFAGTALPGDVKGILANVTIVGPG